MTQRRPVVATLALAFLAGCSGPAATAPQPPSTRGTNTPGPTLAVPPTPQPSAAATEGPAPTVAAGLRVDVGGHSLFISCIGTGSPTIVYLHGSIDDQSVVPHSNGVPIQTKVAATHRMCVYDRRNLGASDRVEGVQLPDDAIADLHALLTAAEIEPPYVLLGASFGGLLSYLYANRYPDEIAGMVLLDSPFPDELELEALVPPADRYEAFDESDEQDTLEHISHYKVLVAAKQYIGEEPQIPVTYLRSADAEHVTGDPTYDSAYLKALDGYIARFAPGRLVVTDAPHFMEQAIPEQIADEILALLASLPPS